MYAFNEMGGVTMYWLNWFYFLCIINYSSIVVRAYNLGYLTCRLISNIFGLLRPKSIYSVSLTFDEEINYV